MDILIYTLIGIFVTAVGALPFGLVNLSVLNISFKEGITKAMKVSCGATLVEIAFGLIAISFGAIISSFILANPIVNYLILGLVAATGIFLFFKSESKKKFSLPQNTGFYKGIFLNAISLQVLLYWLLAVLFIYSNGIVFSSSLAIFFFIIGIVIGKFGVLYLFALSSKRLMSKYQSISSNINKIIGVVLIISVLIQTYRL